ncbi:hypothetical protein SpCBS45565_g01841 [Spizellomyces sp. 'palustris']|nr:hypothetical protein SpCBS45565_g01841 [Spizellomyces sp. 'palustris']
MTTNLHKANPNSLPVTILVHLRSKPEHQDAVSALLQEAASIYIKDQGTIAWHVMQSPSDPNQFAIVERYESVPDIETHKKNPFYNEFGRKVKDLLDGGLKIEMFRELGKL